MNGVLFQNQVVHLPCFEYCESWGHKIQQHYDTRYKSNGRAACIHMTFHIGQFPGQIDVLLQGHNQLIYQVYYKL